MPFGGSLNPWANVKNQPRFRWPVAALIQPCRGAPPEPLGDGTQASLQPSLKSVENGSGRQESGSGWPKTDSVIVSKIPSSIRAAVGAATGPGLDQARGTVVGPGITAGGSTGSTSSAKLAAGIPAADSGGVGIRAGASPGGAGPVSPGTCARPLLPARGTGRRALRQARRVASDLPGLLPCRPLSADPEPLSPGTQGAHTPRCNPVPAPWASARDQRGLLLISTKVRRS